MSIDKAGLWADLTYALDELDRHGRFTSVLDYPDASELDAQSVDEFHERLRQLGRPAIEYFKAKARADTRNAHEAIEKGLKAILIDGGLSESQVRSRGHELHRLLSDVQQYNPAAFSELERCFDSTIQYLERVTSLRYNTSIVDYFLEHGKAEVFVAKRYESIEGRRDTYEGMIGLVYREIIRALSLLIFGWSPLDIGSRIEEEAKKAVMAEGKKYPDWNVSEWLTLGPVRPRLEIIENLRANKALRAAVRRCARESENTVIRYWAERLRHDLIAATRKARTEHQSVQWIAVGDDGLETEAIS